MKYYKIYLNDVKTGGRVGDAADSLGEMLRELDRLGLVGKVRAGSAEQRTVLGVSIAFADKQQSSTTMREVDEDKLAAAPAVEAKAFIDGKPVELDALHPVDAGDHVVRAEAPGYQPAEKQVHVFAGAPQNTELVLEPLPARVTIETEPGASLIVDGRGVGEVPQSALSLSGGTHVITVLRTGRKPVARELTVTRDQALKLPIALEPTARRRAVPWVIGAGGVALGVTGVMALGALYYDGKAVDRQKRLDQGDQDASVLDDYRRYKSRRDAAISMMWVASGATVALGLTAAWLYYFDNPSSEGVQVVPFAGGAGVAGRF